MKRVVLLITGLLLLTSSGFILSAQNSQSVIAEFNKNMNTKESSIEMEFTFMMYDNNGEETGEFNGMAIIQGEMYIILSDVVEIKCNGEKIWIYNKQNDEIVISQFITMQENALMNPSTLFSAENQYLKYSKELKDIGPEWQIELLPKGAQYSFSKLAIDITKGSYLPKKLTLYGKNTGKIVIDIYTISKNDRLSDSAFFFDVEKYPSAYVMEQ